LARDPYQVLGLDRKANEADVKKAFRKLAKQHHPDRAGSDPADQARAKERFAELNTAYEILGDEAKRGQFDRGEIDAEGKPRFQGFGGQGPGGFDPRAGGFGQGGFGQGGFGGAGFDPADIFGSIFGDAARRNPQARARAQAMRGADIEATLQVTLAESAEGATKRLRLPGGREVDVTLPRGIADGKVMRLRGLGGAGAPGADAGDVMLTVKVSPDDRFEIRGHDLIARVPVALETAVLGGPVRVPTLTGQVELTLPAMTSSGKTFRLRGKGLPDGKANGDLLARIEILLPADDAELTALFAARQATLS
jgi:DnaJ-class molecular chaperone